MTFTERLFRESGKMKCEKYIYDVQVHHFVICEISPEFEAYFFGIAQRMGRSFRALSGG